MDHRVACGCHYSSDYVSVRLHFPWLRHRHGLVRLGRYEVGRLVMCGIGRHLEYDLGLDLWIHTEPIARPLGGYGGTQSVARLLCLFSCYAVGVGRFSRALPLHYSVWHCHGIDHLCRSHHVAEADHSICQHSETGMTSTTYNHPRANKALVPTAEAALSAMLSVTLTRHPVSTHPPPRRSVQFRRSPNLKRGLTSPAAVPMILRDQSRD